MKILVVDESAAMRRIIRNLLTQLGYTDVDDTNNGVIALTMLRSGTFGMVIAEWQMAPMTGLQLLKEVRADPKLRQLPFVMITAESKTENLIAAKEAGVSNYIVKPFNAETLKQKIQWIL